MKTKTNSIGISGILGVVFVTLKLTGYITWSWWWVTLPFWWGIAIAPLVLVIAIIMWHLR
jgi:hypothetical protein